jgi:ribosomal protein S18 acetylase RimI-like enzyme
MELLTNTFRERIADTDGGTKSFTIAQVRHEVVGYISTGPARKPELGADGEIYAINILQRFTRLGIGRKLMQMGASHLDKAGYRSIGLWVLEKNVTAISFYKSLGAEVYNSIGADNGGVDLVELAMRWTLPAALRETDETD